MPAFDNTVHLGDVLTMFGGLITALIFAYHMGRMGIKIDLVFKKVFPDLEVK